MKRSTDRILTTHVGSLVRPPDVLEDILLMVARKSVDRAAFEAKVKAGVAAVVRRQAEVGIDIPSDGEFSKPSFTSYVSERLGGLGPTPPGTTKPYRYAKLTDEFPGFMAQYNAMFSIMWMPPSIPKETISAALAAPPDVHSVVGADQIPGPGAIAARHRQLQGGARRDKNSSKPSCPRPRRRARTSTPIRSIRVSRPISTRSPMPCTRNTRRSSMPASSCSSISACPRATRSSPANNTRPGKKRGARRRCRSRPTTTPCAASPRTACAIICAGAA